MFRVLINDFYSQLNRSSIGSAHYFLQRDLGLSDMQYSWSASIFFVTYTIFEIPSNVFLKSVGARLWIFRIALTVRAPSLLPHA